MNDNLIKRLQEAGYICLHLEPTKWRIRGEFGYVDIYPVLGKLKLSYEPKAQAVPDLYEAVKSLVAPYPPLRSPEAQAAFEEREDRWNCFVYEHPECFTHVIPRRKVASR